MNQNSHPDFFPSLRIHPRWVSDTVAIGELEGAGPWWGPSDQGGLDIESGAPPSFGNDPNSNGSAIESFQRLLIVLDGLRG